MSRPEDRPEHPDDFEFAKPKPDKPGGPKPRPFGDPVPPPPPSPPSPPPPPNYDPDRG